MSSDANSAYNNLTKDKLIYHAIDTLTARRNKWHAEVYQVALTHLLEPLVNIILEFVLIDRRPLFMHVWRVFEDQSIEVEEKPGVHGALSVDIFSLDTHGKMVDIASNDVRVDTENQDEYAVIVELMLCNDVEMLATRFAIDGAHDRARAALLALRKAIIDEAYFWDSQWRQRYNLPPLPLLTDPSWWTID